VTAPAADASSVHMIVLPGGGYAEHAVHEGEDASPELRRSTLLDALVTPGSPPFFSWHTAEDPTSRPNTPTASPPHSRPGVSRTPCTGVCASHHVRAFDVFSSAA